MATTSSRGISGIINQFIKGAVWGFIAFVHVALITVLTFKFTLSCLPAEMIDDLSCAGANCPKACEPANDLFFYILSGGTAIAFLLLPLGFGIFWVMKSNVFDEPQNPS